MAIVLYLQLIGQLCSSISTLHYTNEQLGKQSNQPSYNFSPCFPICQKDRVRGIEEDTVSHTETFINQGAITVNLSEQAISEFNPSAKHKTTIRNTLYFKLILKITITCTIRYICNIMIRNLPKKLIKK